MSPIRWLSPDAPPDAFPPVCEAERDPNGLLAVGADLKPERLLHAYGAGIFPWYETGQPVLWWSPDPRAVLRPERLHVARSLRKKLAKRDFSVTADQAFDAVIAACAEPRRYTSGTWITTEMAAAYRQLHALGWAHSFETWREGQLVGGLYGISIGRVFFGESMFSRISDASKIAFVRAVRYLQHRDCALIDCQVWSEHIASLGATQMPRAEFIDHLKMLCKEPGAAADWSDDFARVTSALEGPSRRQ
jgi:leucyl/phenylalanyl-tRNA---protein transferase